MTAVRADGPSGDIGFDGVMIEVHRKRWRKKGLPARSIPLAVVQRVDFKEPGPLSGGYIRIAVPGQIEKSASNDLNHVAFDKGQAQAFHAIRDSIQAALAERGELSASDVESIAAANTVAAARRMREIAPTFRPFANYAGHMVRDGHYQHGLLTKRSICGAIAEFEAGSDRTRPTLTRIGAGVLLAGPVGAIAGGMFKKDRTKAYVTIVFPDGATVIIDGPAKDEKKMRQFANSVNGIARSESDRAASENESGPTSVALSIPDQLLKLKELHGAGVLTDEEYDLKSAPLIAAL